MDLSNENVLKCPFQLRIGYPHRHYRFGKVCNQMPRHLLDLFYDYNIEFFNLGKHPESHQTIAVSEDDCMCLARLFSEFIESPISVFRNHALFTLEKNFMDESESGAVTHQIEILCKYFGQPAASKRKLKELPYQSFGEWLYDEAGRASLGQILAILLEEYGRDIFSLDFFSYASLEKPTIANGIPSFTTESGRIFNIVLEKSSRDKVLALNTCSFKEAGRTLYCCAEKPSMALIPVSYFTDG